MLTVPSSVLYKDDVVQKRQATGADKRVAICIPDRKQGHFLAATRWVASPVRCSGPKQLLAKELDSSIDFQIFRTFRTIFAQAHKSH
jgi:hypothetical protein